MKNILKSSKILGLEKLIERGLNVPEFGVITDFESLNINYCALNHKYTVAVLFNQIEKTLLSLGESKYGYSLRSASFDEDGSEISSAGKYTSYNGLKDLDEIYNAAINIWRHHRSIVPVGVLCPLILQKTVSAYYSGVLFSSNKDNIQTCVIESYYGSCKSIVDGIVLPYRSTFVDSKWDHDFSPEKKECYRFYSHSGLYDNFEITTAGSLLKHNLKPFPAFVRRYDDNKHQEIMLYGYRPSEPPEWYEKNICEKLKELALKLDEGSGVDVEWGCSEDGELSFYQFRSLTTPLVIVKPERKYICGYNFDSSQGDIFYGIPASPGIIKGYVSRNKENTSENKVLLLEEARIRNVKDIMNASAVICLSGGMLSHLAIVCRELKKPCVVAVQTYIADGTFVEIDGDSGIVKILDNG